MLFLCSDNAHEMESHKIRRKFNFFRGFHANENCHPREQNLQTKWKTSNWTFESGFIKAATNANPMKFYFCSKLPSTSLPWNIQNCNHHICSFPPQTLAHAPCLADDAILNEDYKSNKRIFRIRTSVILPRRL